MDSATWGLVVLAVVVVAVVLGRVTARKEPKRFGLKEAEAAAAYVEGKGPGAASAVLGVVVGVLGYRSTVMDDVAKLQGEMSVANEAAATNIQEERREIANLEAKIRNLEADIAGNRRQAEHAAKIADLFSL